MSERISGVVKFFNDKKGYGFIIPDDGKRDVFLHASVLANGDDLGEGDKVSFEVVEGPKGRKAAAVRLEG